MRHTLTLGHLRALSTASLLAVLLAAAAPAWSADAEPFTEILEASLKDKKGVVLYVKGQAIAGRVTRLWPDAVEMSSREYARIVVRRESIDGIASN